MTSMTEKTIEDLLDLIEQRAENLFLTRQHWCAGSVFIVLNQGLGGGIPHDAAMRLVSGLGEGIGGQGCVCGALSGAALAVGLFLGSAQPGLRSSRGVMASTRILHERFKARFRATCCRVLIKSVKHGSAAHFDRCSGYTGMAARAAAELILAQKNDLFFQANWDFLNHRDSLLGARIKMTSALLRSESKF
jgi:C_GCAxxG_C_C family probable redox protein